MEEEKEIKHSKKELLDCIHNLMALVDTPIARRKLQGNIADETIKEARKIMEENNRSLYEI